jgi:hypothetical protein
VDVVGTARPRCCDLPTPGVRTDRPGVRRAGENSSLRSWGAAMIGEDPGESSQGFRAADEAVGVARDAVVFLVLFSARRRRSVWGVACTR